MFAFSWAGSHATPLVARFRFLMLRCNHDVIPRKAHRGLEGCNCTVPSAEETAADPEKAAQTCGEEPLLLKGHARDWAALDRWDLEHLEAQAAAHNAAGGGLQAEETNRESSTPPAVEGSQFAVGTCAKADHIMRIFLCFALHDRLVCSSAFEIVQAGRRLLVPASSSHCSCRHPRSAVVLSPSLL